MTNRFRRALLAVALALALAPAHGADPVPAGALAPRLAALRASGTVRIGFREDTLPFAYRGPGGQVLGYSIDICREVVDTLADDLGHALAVSYVVVTAEDRMRKVADGEVDFECGATTNTAERRRQVAFSPAIFVTSTRLAVPRASRVRDIGDARGKRVAVVGGTTAEHVLGEMDRLFALAAVPVPVRTYADAVALAAAGKVDAVIADEALLRAALAASGRTSDLRLVGGPLSLEPYGIVYPKDEPALDDAVQRTLARLARTREIAWIYERWFVRRLPSGERLDMPMSPQVRRAFEILGLPPD